ncbi:MAG: CDP-diacylglycerol--glycerol-3-phosphate 3-phosphatidyltransferase [Candidatus Hydrogenedentota bacterium]
MTLANYITLGRVALIPVFAALVVLYTREQQWLRYAALGVFLTAAASDGVDGLVARKWNQRTKLGMALDPLADKLLLNLTFVFLAVNDAFLTPVPKWVPVIVLGRDVVVVLGAYLINEHYGPVKAAPHVLGKLTTAAQMTAIVAVLLELPGAWVTGILYTMVAVTLLSLLDYIVDGIGQVRSKDNAL